MLDPANGSSSECHQRMDLEYFQARRRGRGVDANQALLHLALLIQQLHQDIVKVGGRPNWRQLRPDQACGRCLGHNQSLRQLDAWPADGWARPVLLSHLGWWQDDRTLEAGWRVATSAANAVTNRRWILEPKWLHESPPKCLHELPRDLHGATLISDPHLSSSTVRAGHGASPSEGGSVRPDAWSHLTTVPSCRRPGPGPCTAPASAT